VAAARRTTSRNNYQREKWKKETVKEQAMSEGNKRNETSNEREIGPSPLRNPCSESVLPSARALASSFRYCCQFLFFLFEDPIPSSSLVGRLPIDRLPASVEALLHLRRFASATLHCILHPLPTLTSLSAREISRGNIHDDRSDQHGGESQKLGDNQREAEM
jgi:hypothetical protein